MQIKTTMRDSPHTSQDDHHQKVLQIINAGGTSLVAQWLKLRTPNAGGPVSIPGQGTRSHMHATTKSSHATTTEPMGCN